MQHDKKLSVGQDCRRRRN